MENTKSQSMQPGRIVDIDRAVEIVPLKKSTFYSYVARRKIPFLKIGSRVLFDIDELTRWVDQHRIAPLSGTPVERADALAQRAVPRRPRSDAEPDGG